mmetsp:Transcript_22181/g.48365  ORF Transcript_22181/g.48365 Transcript_22181/m.48365 type:complete len:403 (-) Transcript_22181:424-1632(-)
MSRTILISSLPKDPSRYELLVARPDDDSLHIMWTGWAVISAVSATASAVVLLGVALSPETRCVIFNVYVLGLLFPDFVFSFFCAMTCTVNAVAPLLGINHVPWMCEIQSVYCIFGFVCSPWMNAIAGREVCRLLHANRWAEVYRPPSMKTAWLQVACVYLWASFVAIWTLIPGLPHSANAIGGMACLPAEYDIASTIFFWGVFVPSFIGVPLVYTLFISIRTWLDGTLRVASRARSLAFFYMRILMVFLLFWAPTVLFVYVAPLNTVWLAWAGGSWSHLQGLASALLCLTKRDVYNAVIELPHKMCGLSPPARALQVFSSHNAFIMTTTTMRRSGLAMFKIQSRSSVGRGDVHAEIDSERGGVECVFKDLSSRPLQLEPLPQSFVSKRQDPTGTSLTRSTSW